MQFWSAYTVDDQQVSRKFQTSWQYHGNISQWNHTSFAPGSNMQLLSAAKIALIKLLQQKVQMPMY